MSRERAQKILTECFGPFGPIKFPYYQMGRIDSLHLFGLDTELPIFAMYAHNRNRWRNVLDIGANLGLHSICMARMGFLVRAYEPDFEHYQRLIENITRNSAQHQVKIHMAAVHDKNGEAPFVRVLNNLTGNHLEGFKDSYGPLEKVIVTTVDARDLWPGTDFAKIDSEGNEAVLIETTTEKTWEKMQAVLEVRNGENAAKIYRHLTKLGVPCWSQKIEWGEVRDVSDMPHMNREGSLFIGHKGPW